MNNLIYLDEHRERKKSLEVTGELKMDTNTWRNAITSIYGNTDTYGDRLELSEEIENLKTDLKYVKRHKKSAFGYIPKIDRGYGFEKDSREFLKQHYQIKNKKESNCFIKKTTKIINLLQKTLWKLETV